MQIAEKGVRQDFNIWIFDNLYAPSFMKWI